jgi:hypothetical protein
VSTQAWPVIRRGTTNTNVRGGSEDRRRRREWLVQTFRANKDLVVLEWAHSGSLPVEVDPGTEGSKPACRCYARNNIRPSCMGCASYTGAMLGVERKRELRARK